MTENLIKDVKKIQQALINKESVGDEFEEKMEAVHKLEEVADYLKDGHTIYYSCTEGIYTYDLDKDTSEQIVDGNMSSLVSDRKSVV